MLETGEIERLASVGNYASYCRCVGSKKISNGKRKGSGNTKNGNKYLAWAFVEAANFAIRFNSRIKSFYQKKKSKSHKIVAFKYSAANAGSLRKLSTVASSWLRDTADFDFRLRGSGSDRGKLLPGRFPLGRPLARLRCFAAEQQEVTWWEVRFGVKEARRSGSTKPSRHWCFVPVH